MFVSLALEGQVIGLKQEGVLRWRARFFDVDLGTLEIVPVIDVVDTVSSLVTQSQATRVSAPVTPKELLNDRAVNP